ncbi:hypothetical protein J4Q44_G00250780 [Coregonus suidteri]|uniref:tRNA (guanine(37)-N1)-methyltransferase n=1 Tax=Coregonus suidteri TaxID=861788 RepID=A0AAN8QX22_9TELE
MRRVVGVEGSDDDRLLLLDPAIVSSPNSFSDAEAKALRSFGVPQELQHYELRLTYDNLKSEEVLRAVLPEGQDVTSGFSRVGHIAHMNLREHQLPYRNLIGQVIMDKNPGVTCVVNKTNTIDSTYRFFKMEVMAGEENMVAKVRENGVTYELDFSCVYWNPRLSTEHERVVALLKRGDTVLDVFAGVGPFAIPAARRGCTVLANDLNPESHRWLQHNCKLNKVERKVTTFNLDGRAFIQGPLKQKLPALLHEPACLGPGVPGCLQRPPGPGTFLRCEPAAEGWCSVHLVRNVAPNKEMMCVSFTIPKEVLFSSKSTETGTIEEPAPKRHKCGETTD